MSEIIVICPTNADATVDKDGFCTAHGNDCADYAQSRRAEPTVTGYLSDGRHIEVPRRDAVEWGREAAELDTTLGLGDWYTDQGDERQDEIQGKPEDDPRCDHLHQEETPKDIKRARVTNASQADGYDASRNHASAWVCAAPACILDGLAWVQRATGESAVWLDEAGVKHTALPQAVNALEFPLDQAAAEALMDKDGFATFTIALGKDEYLEAVADSDRFEGDSVEDWIHDRVLTFGLTYDSTTEAVAIDGPIITVEYTTSVAEALKLASED